MGPNTVQSIPSVVTMPDWLTFPAEEAVKLERHLPLVAPLGPGRTHAKPGDEGTLPPSRGNAAAPSLPATTPPRPFVTLTFATSLDSSLALAPGVRTAISGPESKAMTHFLRSRHDAILIGAGTAVADDPGLNCRLASSRDSGGPERQPRPIVLDPRSRWIFSEGSKVLQLARAGQGLAPFIITTVQEPPTDRKAVLEAHGGKFIVLDVGKGRTQDPPAFVDWEDILSALYKEGIRSIMIEGGGNVINTILSCQRYRALVDSVILTIAPTWLGRGGVVVSPDRAHDHTGATAPPLRLTNVSWHPLGNDVVLCGEMGN